MCAMKYYILNIAKRTDHNVPRHAQVFFINLVQYALTLLLKLNNIIVINVQDTFSSTCNEIRNCKHIYRVKHRHMCVILRWLILLISLLRKGSALIYHSM